METLSPVSTQPHARQKIFPQLLSRRNVTLPRSIKLLWWSTETTAQERICCFFPRKADTLFVTDGIVFFIIWPEYGYRLGKTLARCICTYHLSSTLLTRGSHDFSHLMGGSFLVIWKPEVTIQLPEIGQKTNGGRAGPRLLSLWSFIEAELPSEYLTGCSRASVKLHPMNIHM